MHYRGDEILFDWIADNTSLAQAVAKWGDDIALDTEFIRTDTYYPLPGLYQVASADHVYLIDPLAITDWQPLSDYLLDPDTVIVMHACQEDLELIHHQLGLAPVNVFDTQLANAFVSTDFSLSYAALVERTLGVALQKHATRSNWLQRPLTDEQIHYAVEDVVYLRKVYEHLNGALEQLDRRDWYDEDMRGRAQYTPVVPENYFQNVKKAWQLNRDQLAILQTLCAWRERTAQREDVPRSRVIWDEHLLSFAREEQLSTRYIQELLPRGVAQRYAPQLLEQHAIGRDSVSPELLPKPLSTAQNGQLKALRSAALAVVENMELAPELLARKRDIEGCLRHYLECQELSDIYQTWRGDLLADIFLQKLQTFNGEAHVG